jgi:hypothetical protein
MPNVMNEFAQKPEISTEFFVPENREGDWAGYLDRVSDRNKTAYFSNVPYEVLAYKRQCAFAYLGKRAQLHGGVCTKTPRVLTEQLVAELEKSNRAKRYARYPWLEKLINLMAEIERIQDQQISSPNVFTLVQSV